MMLISGCGSHSVNLHKVFFWLLISDRLNTKYILRRKSMELQSYDGVFCVNRNEETA